MKLTKNHLAILAKKVKKILIGDHKNNFIIPMFLLSAHIMCRIVIELEMHVNRRFGISYQLKFECLLVPVVAEPTDVLKDWLS